MNHAIMKTITINILGDHAEDIHGRLIARIRESASLLPEREGYNRLFEQVGGTFDLGTEPVKFATVNQAAEAFSRRKVIYSVRDGSDGFAEASRYRMIDTDLAGYGFESLPGSLSGKHGDLRQSMAEAIRHELSQGGRVFIEGGLEVRDEVKPRKVIPVSEAFPLGTAPLPTAKWRAHTTMEHGQMDAERVLLQDIAAGGYAFEAEPMCGHSLPRSKRMASIKEAVEDELSKGGRVFRTIGDEKVEVVVDSSGREAAEQAAGLTVVPLGPNRTRDGREVRVIANDLKNPRFPVCYVEITDDVEQENARFVSATGSYLNLETQPHGLDLIGHLPPEPPKPREIWVAPFTNEYPVQERLVHLRKSGNPDYIHFREVTAPGKQYHAWVRDEDGDFYHEGHRSEQWLTACGYRKATLIEYTP